jgi:hypothetical protein
VYTTQFPTKKNRDENKNEGPLLLHHVGATALHPVNHIDPVGLVPLARRDAPSADLPAGGAQEDAMHGGGGRPRGGRRSTRPPAHRWCGSPAVFSHLKPRDGGLLLVFVAKHGLAKASRFILLSSSPFT